MKTNEYWLITLQNDRGGLPSTVAIDSHPADWLAEYGDHEGADGSHRYSDHLIFAMPITKEQFERIDKLRN